MKKILLVISLQKQFRDKNGFYEKCRKFISKNGDKYFVIATLFQNTPNSLFVKKLNYNDCIKSDYNDLQFRYDYLITQRGYTLPEHSMQSFIEMVKEEPTEIHIMGCDIDACVLAVAYQLWDAGISFKILKDYVFTTAEDLDTETLFKVMERNFGDCLI